MALTAEDVVNKRFSATKFREGYDQDEVDDFLDEVVVELRRLNQENNELRQQLAAANAQGSEFQRGQGSAESAPTPPPVGADAPFGASADVPAPAAPAAPLAPAAPAAPFAPVSSPAAPAAPGVESGGTGYSAADINPNDPNSTNNLLQLARRLHEEHVREGVEKRDALIAEGHATAARIVNEAEAKQRAELGSLEEEKSVLERSIDELRTFEREYRQKLKGHIEGLLQELDSYSVPASAPSASTAPAQLAPPAPASAGPATSIAPPPQAPAAPDFGQPQGQQPPPASFPGFGGN